VETANTATEKMSAGNAASERDVLGMVEILGRGNTRRRTSLLQARCHAEPVRIVAKNP
jgi:hypothetical protein